MASTLIDPNNHVPGDTPDDGWGDAEGVTPKTAGPANVLPPRRPVAEPAAGAAIAAAESGQTGLRIEPNLMREVATDSPIRLEVQEISGSVVRLNQMVPAPPKVPRQVTFRERPAMETHGNKSPDEMHEWGAARHRPTRWILGAGVAVILIVVLVMMLLPAINAPNRARPVPISKPRVEEKIDGVEVMNQLLTKQPEAERIIRAYATATGVDEIVPMLRDGIALKETLQTHWHPLGISKEWQPATDPTWTVLTISGLPCGVLQGTFPDGSEFTACFIPDGNRLLLDWKATAGFGTATFGQLSKGQGDPAEIRGEISRAVFYNNIFPESDYQSYRLISPDGETIIWCYSRRDQAADLMIAQLLRQGGAGDGGQSSSKITLRLEPGPSGAQPNQWLIGEMLHPNWVTP